MKAIDYTPSRHLYLKALVKAGQRPRRHNKIGFTLLEAGLIEWLYPAPDGTLLTGMVARNLYPMCWRRMRHDAIESPTAMGHIMLTFWEAEKKGA